MSDEMTRRAVLAGLGVSAAAGVAGCNNFVGDGADTDMSYGSEVQGTISENSTPDPVYGDIADDQTFTGSDGDEIEITMRSDAFDPYLILTDPDGEKVAQNDDGGPGYASRIETELPADGVYTVWATSFSGEATGAYTLTLVEA